MSKLGRDAELMAAKMETFAKEVEAFSQRRFDSISSVTAWSLLRSSLKLLGACTKVQLKMAHRTAKATKKHFADTAAR